MTRTERCCSSVNIQNIDNSHQKLSDLSFQTHKCHYNLRTGDATKTDEFSLNRRQGGGDGQQGQQRQQDQEGQQ